MSLSYRIGSESVEILKSLDFSVSAGEWVAIRGPSGSGKSTLFYVLGCLLKPSSGSVRVFGADIVSMGDEDRSDLRNHRIGFVFQQFHLLPRTDVIGNILLPTKFSARLDDSAVLARAKNLAMELGLGERIRQLPNALSGGEQQRVAIARALIQGADLILADEPTGNLDSARAAQILEVFKKLHAQGKTIVMITHDSEVARFANRVLHLKDGRLESESSNAAAVHAISHPVSPVQTKERHRPWRLFLGDALKNLIRNRTQSALTMLGVVIGVAAVLAMVTLGGFAKDRILKSYESLGVNQLRIRGHENAVQAAADSVAVPFVGFEPERDLKELVSLFPSIKKISPVVFQWSVTVTFGGTSISDDVRFMGVGADYPAITNRGIALGRGISPHHVDGANPVCLLGSELAARLFIGTTPLDQVVAISSENGPTYACRVIGVLAPANTNKEWVKPNLQVLTPYTFLRGIAPDWNRKIRDVVLQLDPNASVEAQAKKMKAFFENRYGRSGNFWVDSDSTLVAQMKRFLNIFNLLLTAVALLSLIVGGIGINNMILVSVAERLREFGLLRALGATRQDLRRQVLSESILLCGVAGVIGVLFGFIGYEFLIFAATKLISNFQFAWVVDPFALFLSVASIVAVGVLSGLTPAIKAERLEVIEALRSE